MTVRPYGRVVLVLECWEAPDLPYPWIMRNCITIHGQWMYRMRRPSWLASFAPV